MSAAHRKLLWAAVALILSLGVILCVDADARAFAQAKIENSEENVMMAIAPSPERAFTYGERHIDPSNPDGYDVDRAEYFFEYAAQRDPSLPYLYHQLARISFLKGDLTTALAQIDFQIQLHGDSEPQAYYVRGLIEGFMGDYTDAATEYQHFLQFEPDNWAAKNDEAWVLLKAGKYTEALQVANSGLTNASANAWLLNSKATALYELHDYSQALQAAQNASASVANLTPDDWSVAYPGNDPAIAVQGLAAFKQAVADNMHTIELALATSTVQSK